MTSLVTGATGFIGRRLVQRLVQAHGPASVFCLMMAPGLSLEAEALQVLRSSGVRVVHGNLVNRPVSAETPLRVDVVFHLAANTATLATEEEHRVNHEGLSHLLDWLRPVSSGTRIVYASSVAVHDRMGQPTGPIDEESPCVPRTAYGRTKLRAEIILRERARTDRYGWTIVLYGPGQKRGGLFDTLIGLTSRDALLGRIDWPGRTSILHVDDAVDAMMELAERPEADAETFCLASDESLTVGELARGIGHAGGYEIRPIQLPAPALRVMRAIAWNRSIAAATPPALRQRLWQLSLMVNDGFWFDTSKFRRVYRKPLRRLEEGLADTIVRDSALEARGEPIVR